MLCFELTFRLAGNLCGAWSIGAGVTGTKSGEVRSRVPVGISSAGLSFFFLTKEVNVLQIRAVSHVSVRS